MRLKTAKDASLDDGTAKRTRGGKWSAQRAAEAAGGGWDGGELCSAPLYMLQGNNGTRSQRMSMC